jgi:hypothetical protein
VPALIHELTVQRFTPGSDDSYGQPAETWADHATVKALPQPKSIREMEITSQAGAVIGDWTIFMLPSDLRERDRLRHVQATCPVPSFRDLPNATFQPTGIRNAAGVGHHLEVDARLIAASDVEGS